LHQHPVLVNRFSIISVPRKSGHLKIPSYISFDLKSIRARIMPRLTPDNKKEARIVPGLKKSSIYGYFGNRTILKWPVIPIPRKDLMKIILLASQDTKPARTRLWGWKGHCRVLKSGVFFKTEGKYDDKMVLRGYGIDFQVLWEKRHGICPIVSSSLLSIFYPLNRFDILNTQPVK
jgi:hypothetical protein